MPNQLRPVKIVPDYLKFAEGSAVIRVGETRLVADEPAVRGQRIQIQVLARDVIVAAERPTALSVRNVVAAGVVAVTPDVGHAVLLELDIGGTTPLLARITSRAAQDLSLVPGKQVWALIKAVSLRGHVFVAP